MREMYLIAEQTHDAPRESHLPGRLVALVERLGAQYAQFTRNQDEQLQGAIADAVGMLDLRYHVPKDAAETATRLDVLLDEADEFCRQGEHLLTLATPADLLRYRKWYLGEFPAQLSGRPPLPWPEFAAHES